MTDMQTSGPSWMQRAAIFMTMCYEEKDAASYVEMSKARASLVPTSKITEEVCFLAATFLQYSSMSSSVCLETRPCMLRATEVYFAGPCLFLDRADKYVWMCRSRM